MGDGGFWHNGLTSGIANAVFNRSDNLTIVIDNNYTSATGGQDLLSSKLAHKSRSTGHAIERAVRGVGVGWVRTLTNTYKVSALRDTLREALTTNDAGPKVLVAQSECMLNRQRREKPLVKKAVASGERVVRERFGVDADTCTGDHSCIRLNGCPSLSIKPTRTPCAATGRDGHRQLRRLRRLRRSGACGRAVPVLLQGPDRQQPDGVRPRPAAPARRRHRLAAAPRRAPAQPLRLPDAELPADPGRRAAAPSQAPGAVPPRVDSASVEPRPGSSEAPRERVLR
jgi:hypothetical protein